MTYVGAEILSQPECWIAAAELVAEVGEALPAPGERVAVIGCGTSYNMALAYAALREARAHGETDAFTASSVPSRRRYDRVLVLSRSGTTTEVLEALAQVQRHTPTTAITADPRSPIVDAAGRVVALTFADERSIVQTRFATSVLVLLRTHLGDDVADLVSDAQRAVAEPLPTAISAHQQFTFLGQGWTVGVAHEAALKLREAARVWSESYPGMEYRHGPVSVTDDKSVVWLFGPPPRGLRSLLQHTGAVVIVSDLDPLADLVRAQRLAVTLAEQRGFDPDKPRYLDRSVILSGSEAGSH